MGTGCVRRFVAAWALALLGAGCGPSQEDFDRAQERVAHLQEELDAANRRHEQDEQHYDDDAAEIDDLKYRLEELNVQQSHEEGDLRSRLSECLTRTAPECPSSPTGATATSDVSPIVPTQMPSFAPVAPTILYPGNGGGPTICGDGSISGSSGRGTCSHHGGVAGGRHRRH
jgi:hypothetical protein